MNNTLRDRQIAKLEWANANLRAALKRLSSWAERDPVGPADAHGVAQWVRRVIDHGLETGNPENLPEIVS